ncbi:MAG: RNA polymerase sigma factor [Flavobacteriaceae bacterium]
MNQKELIQKCKENNYKAQLEVYKKYKNMLFSSCVRILKSRENAEDIVQDSFIKGFQKIDQIKDGVCLGAWLRRIAVNASLDMIRKQKRTIWTEESNIIETSYEEVAIEEDSGVKIELVKECIQELKEKYRIILVLYLIEDYNHREIGEQLNIKESTVRNQYKRGKSQLLELIQNKTKHEFKRIFSAT